MFGHGIPELGLLHGVERTRAVLVAVVARARRAATSGWHRGGPRHGRRRVLTVASTDERGDGAVAEPPRTAAGAGALIAVVATLAVLGPLGWMWQASLAARRRTP